MSNPNLRAKHKKYIIKFKEEVVSYAKEHSVNETAKKFRIHRKSVQEWKKNEKLSPLLSTTLKKYFCLSNNTASLIIPPKI